MHSTKMFDTVKGTNMTGAEYVWRCEATLRNYIRWAMSINRIY